MPGPLPPPGPDPDHDSFSESSRALLHQLRNHLQARLELLELEAREAAQRAARMGAIGIAAAGLALFAYALVLAALVSLLGHWLAGRWPSLFANAGWQTVALTLGGLHLAGIALLFRRFKHSARTPLFESSRAELAKDSQWLPHHHSRNKSDSSP